MGGADGTELAFAPANYLRELVDVAARYLRLNGAGTGPSPAELARWLGQPVHRLVEPTAAGTTSIAQARIAIEVLQAVVPSVPASLAQEYRSLGLLRSSSASSARRPRSWPGPGGVESGSVVTWPADSASTWSTSTPSRSRRGASPMPGSAQLFGYPSTPDQTGEFQRWRREAIVDGWGRADADDRDGPPAPGRGPGRDRHRACPGRPGPGRVAAPAAVDRGATGRGHRAAGRRGHGGRLRRRGRRG